MEFFENEEEEMNRYQDKLETSTEEMFKYQDEEELKKSSEEMSELEKLRAQCAALDIQCEEDDKFEKINNQSEEYQRSEEESLLSIEEEKTTMEEDLSSQEEYIKKAIEEEYSEDELRTSEELIEEEKSRKSNLGNLINESASIVKHLDKGKGNTQINPGIGLGISPVNIYINGEKGLSVNGGKNSSSSNNRNLNNQTENCSNNYYKNASRIYNNSDWINANNSYQHEKYNYNKMSPCSSQNNSENYLLPCIQPEANKIPQTLNNLMYSKKKQNNDEACPIEINNPWASYKTGDDNENNNMILEGYNL